MMPFHCKETTPILYPALTNCQTPHGAKYAGSSSRTTAALIDGILIILRVGMIDILLSSLLRFACAHSMLQTKRFLLLWYILVLSCILSRRICLADPLPELRGNSVVSSDDVEYLSFRERHQGIEFRRSVPPKHNEVFKGMTRRATHRARSGASPPDNFENINRGFTTAAPGDVIVPRSGRYLLTLTKIRTFSTNDASLPMIVATLERTYDAIAIAIATVDIDALEQHDLAFRIGNFRFEVHCMVEYLSVLAVRTVIQHIGQMLQRGLTGLVTGEVVDVSSAVRVAFAFVLLGLDRDVT